MRFYAGVDAGGAVRPQPVIGLPRPLVFVVFAGDDAVGTEGSYRRIGRPGGVDLRVDIEGCLVGVSGSRAL